MRKRGTDHWLRYAATSKDHVDASASLAAEPVKQAGPPPLLQGLSDAETAAALAVGTSKVLYRGAILFKQGAAHDGIYLIESGQIRVFYTAPSGRELTLAYWHPGNFVGGPDVFDTGLHVWSGVAAQNSSVLHIGGAALKQLIIATPALGINVIEGLAFKGRCYSGIAQMLGTRSATERLINLLLHLAQLYGVEEKRGTLIAAAFTHADIANMIGATRQWVTISLTRLSKHDIIATHHSNLVITDVESLVALKEGRLKL